MACQQAKADLVESEYLMAKDHDSPSLSAASNNCEENPSAPTDRKRKRPQESPKPTHPIDYWRRKGHWPEEYFNPEFQAVTAPNNRFPVPLVSQPNAIDPGLFPSTIASSTLPDIPREFKSTPYKDEDYEESLAQLGSFMKDSNDGPTKASLDICQTLSHSKQTYPQNSLFSDPLFRTACGKIDPQNEMMILRDISPMIYPSAQTLATYGSTHLSILYESVDESWSSSNPLYGPRPQPDYSLGFAPFAFTKDQIQKLRPHTGELEEEFHCSYFLGTYDMYFPFFTCEVKRAGEVEIADRQNAHSMTLGVRGCVELFGLVGRKEELDGEIIGFSISHDHPMVRIYGHYPVMQEGRTTFYRHLIRSFDFTEEGGKEKWAAYRFTKNLYDIWVPGHYKRICSVIDELPVPKNAVEGVGVAGSRRSRSFFSD